MIANQESSRSAFPGDTGAVVVVPEWFLPSLAAYAATLGLGLEVVDDGEDDGTPGCRCIPSSAALRPLVHDDRIRLRILWALFSFAATVSALLMIGGLPVFASLSLFATAYSGISLVIMTAQTRRRRRLLDKLVENGF